MRKNSIIILVLILSLFSCKDDSVMYNNHVDIEANLDYEMYMGFIIFKDSAAYNRMISKIIQYDNYERTVWENGIGFNSQKSIITRLINEELRNDSLNRAKYANICKSEICKNDYHSDYYFANLNKDVIKIINAGTADEYWDYKIFDRSMAPFVDKNGLYAIGDTLFQITEYDIKYIPLNKDKEKHELLEELKDSQNVLCKVYSKSVSPIFPSPGEIWAGWQVVGTWPSVQKRIRVGVELTCVEYLVPMRRFEFKHQVYVQCMKTNLFNRWIYDWSNVELSGSWSITAFPIQQTYSNQLTYSSYSSNLVLTVHPGSGNLHPFGTNFLIYGDVLNQELDALYVWNFQPRYNYYSWNAKRTDVNLTSSLTSQNF